jgi:hypothetical protein
MGHVTPLPTESDPTSEPKSDPNLPVEAPVPPDPLPAGDSPAEAP